MTTHERNPDLPRSSGEMSRAALVRAAADDELTPDERRALDRARAADGSIDARIAFEHALRERVAGAMAEPARAPASLRASIEAMVRDQHEQASTVGPTRTRSRRFWVSGPTWLAAAASLALLTAVTVVMRTPLGSSLAPRIGAPVAAQLLNASNFIVQEHGRCSAFDSYFDHKFTVRDASRASDTVVELLGQPPVRIRLDQVGYQFTGIGACKVPGPGASVHMLYRPIATDRPTLSLFIQNAVGQTDVESGVRYRLQNTGGTPVLVWREGSLIYYLFSPDPDAEQSACRLLHAPTTEKTL